MHEIDFPAENRKRGMTIGELRAYLDKATAAGFPDTAVVRAQVSPLAERLRKIMIRDEPERTERPSSPVEDQPPA